MKIRLTIVLLLIAALAFTSGCVYYNTFYHARAAAREAELLREQRAPGTSPGNSEKELLERVAEKCGRVLQLHPDSSWADDALLLLGTTHYHQERYESAERRLTEFISLHPDSDLRPEAEYMLASVLLRRGNPVSAETQLQALVEVEPPHPLSDDALALIGEARHTRKKYDEAAEAYTSALERFPRSDRRAEIRFLAAENYEEAGDLDAAAREFALVPSESGSRAYSFESRMRLAEVDLRRDRPEEALEVLEEQEHRVDSRDDLDRVLLLKGRALEAAGRVEEAISTYEGITASHKRSDASGEAQYRVGVIRRDQYESLEEAIESFRRAWDEAPRTDIAAKATEAIEDVNKLIEYLEIIEADGASEGTPGDGGGEPAAGDTMSAAADFATGLSDSTPSPTAALVDSATASAATLHGDTPGSAAAEAETLGAPAAEADTLGTPAAEADTVGTAGAEADTAATDGEPPVDEVAAARFRAAELYLFRFDDPERAAVHYSAVIEEHPESELAPKAALALAWALEFRLDDDAGALETYRSVITDYPDTEFSKSAAQAVERLSGAGETTP